MKPDALSSLQSTDFDRPYRALKDTEWKADPANPADSDKGFIHEGETIWLHPQLLLNTPDWQLACLPNKTVRYIRHNDFTPVVAQ